MGTESEEITRRFEQIGTRILQGSREELYLHMRYLDLALSALDIRITTQVEGIGTDGQVLAAHPGILADLFEKNRQLVNRVYLHCVLHCLLRHIFRKLPEDETLWHIACDIACESIVDSLRARPVRMGVSRFRMDWYARLRKERKVLTAEGIYRSLREMQPDEGTIRALREQFGIDTHILWPSREEPSSPFAGDSGLLEAKWKEISEKAQAHAQMVLGREAGEGDEILTQLQTANRERYDYRRILRRFASWNEEMQIDPDSFDYVFYTYGLSLYGNMPLIEPQEYREVKKIEEFVVVLDVSMSTRGERVKAFLEETWAALTERESYFRQVHIRILQCDDRIREDRKITDAAELENYMNNLTLRGGGGTDFRPAFAYVQELLERKEFHNLRGMLYFTDGKGVYPALKPSWETAFVFLEEDGGEAQVPPWAIRVVIPLEELRTETDEKKLRMDYRFLTQKQTDAME